MKTTLLILASVLVVLGIAAVYALDTATVAATVSVPGTISITSAAGLQFGSVERGQSAQDTLDITIDSNKAYKVESKADATNFKKDGGADATIPRENLEWYTGSVWTDYSGTLTQIATGSSPGTTHNINHQLTIPASAVPAIYTLDVTVKATQT